jgi:cytochrome c
MICLWTGLSSAAQPSKDLFERRCGGCHSATKDKVGPRLAGVVGRAAASVPSFPYSDALRSSHIVWNEKTLDQWLAGPDLFVPNSEMEFRMPSAEERKAVIAYLRELR